MVSHFLCSQPVGGWVGERSEWFPMTGRFVGFQRREKELRRGHNREGCWLVMAAGGSCLGVMGCDVSGVNRVVGRQLLWGKEGGFVVCNRDFHYIPSKTTSFWCCLNNNNNSFILIGQFIRFTSRTADSTSPTPIQCNSGLIDGTKPELWLVSGRSDPIFKTMSSTSYIAFEIF